MSLDRREFVKSAAALVEGVAGMPGCLSYVVGTDPADADAIWVTEVWNSAASHQASLALPSVRQAIATGRPLIAMLARGETLHPPRSARPRDRAE